MSKRKLALALLAAAPLAAATAGEVTLNAARVTAKDSVAIAQFYQAAFGLKEVQRLQVGKGVEIMLNFGATVDAAKANKNAQVVVMPRDSDSVEDPTAHLIFQVTDMAATVKSIKAAGGRMEREPFEFGKTGIHIGLGQDPAGNHFELLQFPAGG